MIDEPTLFILGAGASVPYGYPTGAQLRRNIIENYLYSFKKILGNSGYGEDAMTPQLRKALCFLDKFEQSGVISIDKFLSINPKHSYYGRLAIATIINDAENLSKFDEKMAPENAKQDWYKLLFNRMITACNKADDYSKFKENKVTFITFNYDRSLEHYLFRCFSNTFCEKRSNFEGFLNPNNFREIIPFRFLHVYGQVDQIECLGGTPYGSTVDFIGLESQATNIRVIGERADEVMGCIDELIVSAKRIFFLGFGFAEENIEALGLSSLIDENTMIYASTYGMTKRENDAVNSMFVATFSNKKCAVENPKLLSVNSYDLLREYL